MGADEQADSRYSSLREKIVEHVFLGEVLRALWNAGVYTIEVSRAESDSFGYDVVLECGKIVRHIQLKSRGRTKGFKPSISRSLADKPGGCVVCVILGDDLRIGPFLWFGGEPGKPLPDIRTFPPSKRSRGGKRENHVDVPLAKFDTVATIFDLVSKLFALPAKPQSAFKAAS